MKTKADTLPLLHVTWLDAGVIGSGDWLSYEEIIEEAKDEKFINSTCGYLVSETETAIVLAGQWAIDSDKPYDLVTFIPKSLIRKRKVLKI